MVTQTPWLNRSWQFNFDAGLFPIIYSRLYGIIPRLNDVFANVDENKASVSEKGWTAKEHLGHLYDLEDLWWNRWEDFKASKEILTPADITNRRTTEANHNAKSTRELLNAFVL